MPTGKGSSDYGSVEVFWDVVVRNGKEDGM